MPERGMRESKSLMESMESFVLPKLDTTDHNSAKYSFEIIKKQIKNFEDSIDSDHEVAVKLASFGQSVTMTVTDIGYANPNTLIFYGYVGEQPATLIQHMTQLNFLLLSVKRANPEEPKRKIGFIAD